MKRFVAAALLASALPALADNAKAPQPAAPGSVPPSAAANALRPDLAVSLSPDAPGAWPAFFTVKNVGGSKSEAEYFRIGVFVVGEDPLTKKNCVPRYTGLDVLIPALTPGESRTVSPAGFVAANVKYMPALPNTPPPAVRDGTMRCTFQVGGSLADVGKNDANKANDTVTRNLTFTTPVKP